MATDVVYDPPTPGVAPASVTVPDGYDAPTVLAAVSTVLPWEDDYQDRLRRAFTLLSGEFVFTFPAGLTAPAGWTVGPATLLLFVDGRGGSVADRVTAPEAAAVRELYGAPFPHHPRARGVTLKVALGNEPSLSQAITFTGVRVAAVRATLQAW